MIIDNSTCKLIEDFPGYCVDINGGIWTCWTTGRKMTNVWRRLNGRRVRGYIQITLYKNGIPHFKYAHVIVLETFVGPRPDGMEVRHFPDNNRANNTLSNLSWGSPKENGLDKISHGTSCRGENSGKSKLTEKDVLYARELFKKGYTIKEVSNIIGVSKSCISEMKRGATWSWLQ